VTAVVLRGEEREVALAEVDAVRAVVDDDGYRQTLDDLRAGLEDGGGVHPELQPELDRLITLTLQSGRARALYGPGGEQALLRAFRKLPTGADVAASARDVNDALGALAGRPLEQATITAVGPGAFTLSLVVDGAELSVRLDRQGVRLASLAL
jgi:hypothetical protein